MAHFFKIGCVTDDNEQQVNDSMLKIDGMRKLNSVADVHLFMSDSLLQEKLLKDQVILAIDGTGALILGD